MEPEFEIVTLRSTCPDGRTCPSVKAIPAAPGSRYVIGNRVTDPALLAAFAPHLGPDESLIEVPTELLPEV
jgi:hypothetical protein